jgi:hypothetical protein
MEYVAASMIDIPKQNPDKYDYRLQEFPTAWRFAICESDVVWLLTVLDYSV